MSDTDALLPCPFCNHEPVQKMRFTEEIGYLAVRCYEHTDWITVEQWNRRRGEAAELQQLRILRQAWEDKADKYYRWHQDQLAATEKAEARAEQLRSALAGLVDAVPKYCQQCVGIDEAMKPARAALGSQAK